VRARGGRGAAAPEEEVIEGVKVKRLKVIPDERGLLMEMMRDDDEFFQRFGQVYLSVVYPGVVKGWHYHKRQTDHFVFVKGMAKVVLYDGRETSGTKGEIDEFFMGEQNPILLVIPPLVLHGMKGVGTEPAYLINTPTEHYVHDEPDEHRVAPHSGEVPYDWNRKDG
jgi:dTDP-4-dehydrorhamnose 3,5-epimerase